MNCKNRYHLNINVYCVTIILTLFLNATLFALTPLYANNHDIYKDVLKLEHLKPGMKGYGKTVFSGTKIENFNVEILGILKNYDAKRDLILVKCTGEVVDETGVIAGMSGSPIYVNNKIIGALSYAWPFSKEAIAGVTPIKEMLNILENDPSKNSFNHNTRPLIPPTKLAKAYTNFDVKLAPIKTPLMVSGFDSNVFKFLGPEFDMLGMTPIQSGSSASMEIDTKHQLEPGSAVGVQLIKGDLSATAVGTVTYKKGNHILAFGHPFVQMGNLDFPMSGAYVHTILSSISLSSKMASATKVLGKITQDRKSGIAGVMGEFSKMIPCTSKIEGSQKIEYNFEIVQNNIFTPNLCQMAFLSTILATENQLGELYVKLGLKIFLDELDSPIVLEDIFYESNASWFPVAQIISPIQDLLNNRFKKINISKIEFSAKLIEKPMVAIIDDLTVDKSRVSPGDQVTVSVNLAPIYQKSLEKKIEFTIPETVKPGSKIMVTACSANNSSMLNVIRSSGKYKPTNFEQYIELIKEVEPNNQLIIHILFPSAGITLKGEKYPSLPLSILSVMTQPNYSGTDPLATEKVFHINTDWVINGGQSILINVKKG